MKAIVYREYGSADVLRYEDIDTPSPADAQVLIQVRAASVNPFDWHFMRGEPYPLRLQAGLRRPTIARLGIDVAGRVAAVGSRVTQFKAGDEVFGAARGAFAEYVCTSPASLAAKPDGLTFEQAAAVPVAALTALQALRDKGHLQPGHTVLVNGAAGGVGTFAVQIAKSFGARVAGVCSTRNVEMVRSIGADRVIDYTQENFTALGKRYDLILDAVGNQPLLACTRALKPSGAYVAVGGRNGRWVGPFGRAMQARVLSPFVRQTLAFVMTKASTDDLATLRELLVSGAVTPVVDRKYALRDAADAIRYVEHGHARGKVVITT
jgi:NADPH:quinone reductase-like Zn-dependent oxidoreductase